MSRILYQLLPMMKKVLKKCNLLKNSGNYPSLEIIKWKDLKNYKKVWEHHYQNRSYHLLLKDLSLFRFKNLEYTANFEYLQSPVYIRERFMEDEEPEEILPTPIRYDYNPQEFNPITHPIGHIHIGLENSIRIGTHCKLTPLSFLLFCLRQMYPNYWKNVIENELFANCKKHIRENISIIDDNYKIAFEREHIIS